MHTDSTGATLPKTSPSDAPDPFLDDLGTDAGAMRFQEAERRLSAHGANRLRAAARATPWAILLDQFKDC